MPNERRCTYYVALGTSLQRVQFSRCEKKNIENKPKKTIHHKLSKLKEFVGNKKIRQTSRAMKRK